MTSSFLFRIKISQAVSFGANDSNSTIVTKSSFSLPTYDLHPTVMSSIEGTVIFGMRYSMVTSPFVIRILKLVNDKFLFVLLRKTKKIAFFVSILSMSIFSLNSQQNS
ncbi:hypothetical protein RF11_03202 [Thelohanellus kitauei]|uniref:Uncharacterized protein n=1 Tax=Thelohanellus kitauei TaxID=669202 RepID=A0A0C2N5I3_THEKT|nr:hypothetical protein RF11_03202 [Thelohanellus kitauei]